MDLEELVKGLNFGQRKELYYLLRHEFETGGYEKDGDSTVEEWMARIPEGKMSAKLSDYLKKQEGKLIAQIDAIEVAKNVGKRATFEFFRLRGY